MPKISVVIPIFNGEVFLRQTLESLSNQKFVDFEVLCVGNPPPKVRGCISRIFSARGMKRF